MNFTSHLKIIEALVTLLFPSLCSLQTTLQHKIQNQPAVTFDINFTWAEVCGPTAIVPQPTFGSKGRLLKTEWIECCVYLLYDDLLLRLFCRLALHYSHPWQMPLSWIDLWLPCRSHWLQRRTFKSSYRIQTISDTYCRYVYEWAWEAHAYVNNNFRFWGQYESWQKASGKINVIQSGPL